MNISHTIEIDAAVGHVFDVFTDLDSAAKHLSGIQKLEMIDGPKKMQLGTRWRETRTMMGKDSTEEMWVSELTKNKSYAVDAESHGTKYHSVFAFEDMGNKTRVTWTFGGTPQTFAAKLMSLSAKLFMGPLKKMLAQDMEELKTACEK